MEATEEKKEADTKRVHTYPLIRVRDFASFAFELTCLIDKNQNVSKQSYKPEKYRKKRQDVIPAL
jgi:hypothetical protein